MNKNCADICLYLKSNSCKAQRELGDALHMSLGLVNKTLQLLEQQDYLTPDYTLTNRALSLIDEKSPRNAVILAAGYGMRMVPINTEFPKALIEINGERLIERLIRQLHAAGVDEIYVVAGFMKEKLEYLIDKYNVKLLVNDQYMTSNNSYSLRLAENVLGNSYILPCDIWCRENPFSRSELYSWYMVKENYKISSEVRVNRNQDLIRVGKEQSGNAMIGISYLTREDAAAVCRNLNSLDPSCFWEDALYEKKKTDVRMRVKARQVSEKDVIEINSYEQLRDLDENSDQLNTSALKVIEKLFSVKNKEITNIRALKKGMTNRSFLFDCRGEKYIMRIPGEGTSKLINRAQEAEVYSVINGRNLCDDVLYINPDNGYKITRYVSGARSCDPNSDDDLKKCMKKLREFHAMHLKVNHTFDIVKMIDFYESLWNGLPSGYDDYPETKANVLSLLPFVDNQPKNWCLTHIDPNSDNFLITDHDIRLIDWEYAGMQDTDVDLAMFCIYDGYSQEQTDHLIDIYYNGRCPRMTRIKIYCYMAMCGLLWSNWCEYKHNLGIEFGSYSLNQYRYAKDYYKLAVNMMEK